MKYAQTMLTFHLLKGIEKRFEIQQRGTIPCKVPPYLNYSTVRD